MPQRTATRRSEGRQGLRIRTHRQWDLFGANLPDSVGFSSARIGRSCRWKPEPL